MKKGKPRPARTNRATQSADETTVGKELDDLIETQTRILQAVNDTLRSHNNILESLKERIARLERQR
jgi:hypothetical protein